MKSQISNLKSQNYNAKLKTEKNKHGSKFEYSAGGVIYRKIGDKVQILLLKDKNDQWSFPKGIIEKGENLVDTAKREISEEVGLNNLVFVCTLDSIGYFYRFQDSIIRKKVDFFLFRYQGYEKPQPLTKEGISEVRWFASEEVVEVIGYAKTNKPILEKALDFIQNS